MSNKSLDFIRYRIDNHGTYGLAAEDFAKAHELNFKEGLKLLDSRLCQTLTKEEPTTFGDSKGEINIQIKYDPDAAFEYFTLETCYCDGSLIHLAAGVKEIVYKLLRRGTCDSRSMPPDFLESPYRYNTIYTVGDFVIDPQKRKSIPINEKPYLTTKYSVALPIKCKFIERED